jgi:hypothetical protein
MQYFHSILEILLLLCYPCTYIYMNLYRIPEGEVNILGSHSIDDFKKKVYMYMCPLPNFSEIEIFHCTVLKLLIRKRYYVLSLMPVFIVQATKLIQFT